MEAVTRHSSMKTAARCRATEAAVSAEALATTEVSHSAAAGKCMEPIAAESSIPAEGGEVMEPKVEARPEAPSKPRPRADEEAIIKIVRSPVAIRRARIRSVRVVSVRARRRRSIRRVLLIVCRAVV